jgi:hypothetical protein
VFTSAIALRPSLVASDAGVSQSAEKRVTIARMIRLAPSTGPSAPPPSRVIWRLVRGEQRAQAVARDVPGVGVELVVTINDELRWAQLYRGGLGLGMAAAEKRQALLDAGWSEAPPRG